MKPVTVTILGRKGGTGKSTLTTNLGACLSVAGRRTLLIDLDGQGSTSRAFFGPSACDALHPMETSAAFFAGSNPEPSQVVRETPFEGLDIVASNHALDSFMHPHAGHDLEIVVPFIEELVGKYDVVLIDTAPNTDAWPTVAGLAASAWAISPIIPDAYGAQSTSDTLDIVERAPHVDFLGFVVSMVERNAVAREYEKAVRDHHADDVFDTVIPKAVAFREAVASRTPLAYLKPKSKPTKVIADLANEIGIRTSNRRRRAA